MTLTIRPLTSDLWPALEADPVDTGRPDGTRNVFTGTASAFACAGFEVVARHAPSRPIMRHDLGST